MRSLAVRRYVTRCNPGVRSDLRSDGEKRHSLPWDYGSDKLTILSADKFGIGGAGSADSRATATLNTDHLSLLDRRQVCHYRSWFGG